MSNARIFLLFFSAALIARLALAWFTGFLFEMRLTEMVYIAISVAENGEYGNPFGHLTGPTAHSAPVFPLFLASILTLLGKTQLAQVVMSTVACLLSALRCALIPLLALDAGLSRLTAMLAGLLSVIYIGAIETEIRGGVDGPYVAICLLGIIWMSLRLWRSQSWQSRSPWAFFALCGFSILLNPAVIPVIAGILLLGFLACAESHRRRFIIQSGWLVLVVFAFLLPWGLRNLRDLDAFILTRSNLGLELWLSNGPDRTYDLAPNYGTYHPLSNPSEAGKVAELGEASYNQGKMKEALAWIAANPGAFASLTARRTLAWWFPPGPTLILMGKGLLTLLALTGIWILRRENRLFFALILTTWLTFPDLYYGIQFTSRMRYPMDWQLVLCAAVSLAAFLELLHPQLAATEDRPNHKPR